MSEEKTIRILPHGKVVAFGVKDNVTRDVAGRLSENDVALEKALKESVLSIAAIQKLIDSGTIGGVSVAADPGSSIDTLGAGSEGSETASTRTWTAGGSNGLAEWYVSRVVYNESGDKKLYAFLRKRTYDAQGLLYSVSAETQVTVDTPVEVT